MIQTKIKLTYFMERNELSKKTHQKKTLFSYSSERFSSIKDGMKAHEFQAWIPIELMTF